MAGEWINPNSPLQVARFLVKRGVFRTDKMSTAAEVLDRYTDHEEVELIQNYRELLKLKSTYIIPLKRYRDRSGRIHTDISLTRTETGRLASSNPNLMNIPVRTELGRKIRNAFVSELETENG